MTFTTQLNTLHQRLLEATREEHGQHHSTYTTVDLLEDLDEDVENTDDIPQLLDELLALDTEDLYCSMAGDNYLQFINDIESNTEPLNLPPPPPRDVDPYEIPPLYEDAIIDPPPYVMLPPY
jgi:hypothetical protein